MKMVIIIILINLIFNLLIAIPVMFLWNYTLPVLFQIPEITWIQAFCLLVLIQLLLNSKITFKNNV